MFDDPLKRRLESLFDRSPTVSVSGSDRYVVLSDLHMSDGKAYDGFKRCSDLFVKVLRGHYLDRGFKLILNGDVEDLQRAKYASIRDRWGEIYSLFDQFDGSNALYKIMGNHDTGSLWEKVRSVVYTHYNSLKLRFQEGSMFVFHGHQSCPFVGSFSKIENLVMKKVANPLRISNPSVVLDKDSIRNKERRIIDFSKDKGLLSLVAHTHRPSFAQDHCVFNSGCSTGSRGLTALEICCGKISLVHWMDLGGLRRYIRSAIKEPLILDQSGAYKVVLGTGGITDLFKATPR